MKKIKKNIFGIGLGLAMVLGVGLGFVPQNVNAGIFGGNKVACWSAGIPNAGYQYINCTNCDVLIYDHEHDGPQSKCKPSS